MTNSELAREVMERIEALAQISDEQGRLTRFFCSPAMRKANDLVGAWMREAGLSVSEDAIGNLIGRYPGRDERAKTFIIGSHLDTVRGAGKFDGALGVLVAIACVQQLHERKVLLPFALEVAAFADAQGVRYGTSHLGSRVLAGTFDEEDLKKLDTQGYAMAEAIRAFGGNPDKLEDTRRDPQKLLGYAEIHIEQGPVLEKKHQPIGIVSSIAGHTRVGVRFIGQSADAGATPMDCRRDALVAAAQFIQAVETCTRLYAGLVATVGQIETRPGTPDLIPGEVTLSLDVCHPSDSLRTAACARLQETAIHSGSARGIAVEFQLTSDVPTVHCSCELSNTLAKAARQRLVEVTELPSGASHDVAAMGDVTPSAMLFVRCKDGVTHHPDESVAPEDLEIALSVMSDFLQLLANQVSPFTGNTAFMRQALTQMQMQMGLSPAAIIPPRPAVLVS